MLTDSPCDQEKQASKGFTLIELLVAMAVAAIMMTLIVGAYWAQTQISREQQMVVEMQQNMRTAINFLKRDIMMAGYELDNDNTLITADAANLSFRLLADEDGIDNDSDGTTDEPNEEETIQYSLTDTADDADALNDDLQRQAGGAAIAGNIENLEFFYTLVDGTQTKAPASLEDIRAVGISILFRTAQETRVTNNATYTTLSGDSWAYNDGFRRQIVRTRVQCRNMLEN